MPGQVKKNGAAQPQPQPQPQKSDDAASKKRKSPSPFEFDLEEAPVISPKTPATSGTSGSTKSPSSTSSSSSLNTGGATALGGAGRLGGSKGGSAAPPAAVATAAMGQGTQVDETDDIHGLLSMIGERLNSKYENKKKKLESQAESALKSVYEILGEQQSTYQRQVDGKMNDFQRRSEQNSADYQKEIERYRKLQLQYQSAVHAIMSKMDQLEKDSRKSEQVFWAEMKDLEKARKKEYTALQKQIETELSTTRMRSQQLEEEESRNSSFLKANLQSFLQV